MKNVLRKIINKAYPDISQGFGLVQERFIGLETAVSKIERQLESTSTLSMQLTAALDRVEPYQPLYRINGFIKNPKRSNSELRCEAIYSALNRDVQNLNILDVGSSLGFVPFYFADKGAHTYGWDTDVKNIEVSNIAKQINGLHGANFSLKHFDSSTLKEIKTGQYDVVCLLSVLHHIIHQRGLEATKKLMAKTLERSPVLFVELAKKEEFIKPGRGLSAEERQVMKQWEAALPDDPLAIFEGIDGISISHIANFDTHLSGVKRPLYMVTKKNLKVGNRSYAYDSLKKAAYTGSTAADDRTYYTSDEYFIKEYKFSPRDDENLVQIVGELNTFLMLRRLQRKTPYIPNLYDHTVEDGKVILVLESVAGDVLYGSKSKLNKKQLKETLVSLALACNELERINIYHNDIRPWNLMKDSMGTVKLIDLGNSSPEQRENNLATFLWTALYYSSGSWSQAFDANKLPATTKLKTYPQLLELRRHISEGRIENFESLANWLKKEYK